MKSLSVSQTRNKMIEGINATLANTALVRPLVDQVERASYAANPEQVQRVPQAPYLSLYVAMNYTIDKAVLQIRDSESAEVLSQIPSDSQIKAYRKAAAQQPVIFEPRADAAEAQRDVMMADTDTTVETISVAGDVDTAKSSLGSSSASAGSSVLISA